jgi:hypothetical protein
MYYTRWVSNHFGIHTSFAGVFPKFIEIVRDWFEIVGESVYYLICSRAFEHRALMAQTRSSARPARATASMRGKRGGDNRTRLEALKKQMAKLQRAIADEGATEDDENIEEEEGEEDDDDDADPSAEGDDDDEQEDDDEDEDEDAAPPSTTTTRKKTSAPAETRAQKLARQLNLGKSPSTQRARKCLSPVRMHHCCSNLTPVRMHHCCSDLTSRVFEQPCLAQVPFALAPPARTPMQQGEQARRDRPLSPRSDCAKWSKAPKRCCNG